MKHDDKILIGIIIVILIFIIFPCCHFIYGMRRSIIRVGEIHAQMVKDNTCYVFPTDLDNKQKIIDEIDCVFRAIGVNNASFTVFGVGDYMNEMKIRKIDDKQIYLKGKYSALDMYHPSELYNECVFSNNTNCTKMVPKYVPNPEFTYFKYVLNNTNYYYFHSVNPMKFNKCDENKYYLIYANVPHSEILRICLEKMNLFLNSSTKHNIDDFRSHLNKKCFT